MLSITTEKSLDYHDYQNHDPAYFLPLLLMLWFIILPSLDRGDGFSVVFSQLLSRQTFLFKNLNPSMAVGRGLI